MPGESLHAVMKQSPALGTRLAAIPRDTRIRIVDAVVFDLVSMPLKMERRVASAAPLLLLQGSSPSLCLHPLHFAHQLPSWDRRSYQIEMEMVQVIHPSLVADP
ncbi:hypothetical protein NPX13_g8757 [Xylaria arbuscula]|uniref:Uncharacterized protein n=1 Tax=Xylaria arbuscula TaxID=114810 RepID=A0A9W8N827_9PEZI|nr:hypothetical protein NPX13_g8757 [Xylaria arbuscula]